MGDQVKLDNTLANRGADAANGRASSAADTAAQSAFGKALTQEQASSQKATQMSSATAINSEKDVATFETRHAYFDVGKQLQTGKLKAKSHGGKELPPPAREQLQRLAGKSKEANRLAKEYSAKQGVAAGHVVKDNVTARSQAVADRLKETPHFGEASQKLIPEVGFKDGKIISVGKNPGGEPLGARTADLGVANKPTPPSEWRNQLVGQKGPEALKSAMDVKGGNAYVSDKAGFKTQSGGLEVEEVRPFTKGLKPSELSESNVAASKALAPNAGAKSGTWHMTPRDADIDAATGKVVDGPNTGAALTRRAQGQANYQVGAKTAEDGRVSATTESRVSAAAEEAEGHATGSSDAKDEVLQLYQETPAAAVDGATMLHNPVKEAFNQAIQNTGGSTSTSQRGEATTQSAKSTTQPVEDSTILGSVLNFFNDLLPSKQKEDDRPKTIGQAEKNAQSNFIKAQQKQY